MNFKENYQREMNEIGKPSGITEKVLNAADMEQETYAAKKNKIILKSSGATWRTAATAIAIACVLGLCLQHEKVISFAQSVLNRFTVSVNNEDMAFGKIEAVKMNIEGFVRDAKTKIVEDSNPASYYQYFSSYQEMYQLTQLEFPGADQVEYREIAVEITPRYKTGHVNAQILYKGVSYNINGMFTLDGFDQETRGYGDKGIEEVYQYGDEKSACFIKDSDGYEKVYFEEGNILFQLHFNTGDSIEGGSATASKEQTKNLLKLFGQGN